MSKLSDLYKSWVLAQIVDNKLELLKNRILQIYYLVVILILGYTVISYLYHPQNMKLLRSVSSPDRGTRAERRLGISMLRRGVHPKAIFHDLYL